MALEAERDRLVMVSAPVIMTTITMAMNSRFSRTMLRFFISLYQGFFVIIWLFLLVCLFLCRYLVWKWEMRNVCEGWGEVLVAV